MIRLILSWGGEEDKKKTNKSGYDKKKERKKRTVDQLQQLSSGHKTSSVARRKKKKGVKEINGNRFIISERIWTIDTVGGGVFLLIKKKWVGGNQIMEYL